MFEIIQLFDDSDKVGNNHFELMYQLITFLFLEMNRNSFVLYNYKNLLSTGCRYLYILLS